MLQPGVEALVILPKALCLIWAIPELIFTLNKVLEISKGGGREGREEWMEGRENGRQKKGKGKKERDKEGMERKETMQQILF